MTAPAVPAVPAVPATPVEDGRIRASRVSGLATRNGRVALLYVVAVGIAQTLVLWDSFRRPWLTVTALAATASGAWLLTSPADDPPPLRVAVPVAVLPVLNAVCLLPQLEPGRPELAWLLAIGCYLGGLLVVRGRLLLAVCGGLVTFALVAVWAAARDADRPQVVMLLALPVAGYVVGMLWHRLLGAHVAALGAHRSAQARAALAAAASDAAAAAVAAELREIGFEAAPLLERVAAGGTLTPGERTEARLLEARLRDRIRARALAHEPVIAACDRARRHGTDVLLLDDGEESHALPAPVLQRIAELVGPVTDGRVTVRVLPPGRDALATVLVDEGGQVRVEVLGRAGTLVRSAG